MTFNLSEKKRKYYKERLAHYLKSYRERNALSQAETAVKIGYATDHYKRLESGIEERIANTLEYLMNFASLDFGNIIDFLVYMENTAPVAGGSRELYPWEQSLLSGFNELPSEVRRDFTAAYCGDKPKSPWSLEEAIEILRSMSRLDNSERQLMEVMLSRLQKVALTDEEKSTKVR